MKTTQVKSELSTAQLAISTIEDLKGLSLSDRSTKEADSYMDGYIQGVFSFASLLEAVLDPPNVFGQNNQPTSRKETFNDPIA